MPSSAPLQRALGSASFLAPARALPSALLRLAAALLLAGAPGFTFAPEPESLRVAALPLPGDPLAGNLRPGAPLGVLGIQAHTQRRNRVNGRVIERDGRGFTLRVDQSFGNCPKYIQSREAAFAGARASVPVQVSERLDPGQRAALFSSRARTLVSGRVGATLPGSSRSRSCRPR